MIRTILYMTLFLITLVFWTVIIILPALLFRLLGMKTIFRSMIAGAGSLFHRLVILGTGARVTIRNLENFPPKSERSRLCLVGNHQSYFDIPLIIGYLPGTAGFVSKKELFRVPLLNLWMYSMGCIALDRSSPRSAVRAIEKGIESIQAGWPIVIFPEGTRSRGPVVRPFKPGSLKLATRSKALIVPISIEGTADLFEIKGKIAPAKVTVTVHPPIDTSTLTEEERKELAARLQKIITEGGESLA
jgi:1-acyl-sn-glycerol-3-phosphate acyltransferase